MKRFISVIFALLITFSFAGCNAANIEVGTKDGVAYFHHAQGAPEIILTGENEAKIEDEALLGKLIAAIDGKSAVNDFCNCEALYIIRIDKYYFGLHSHGISVTRPMGNNIKGVNIFTVECTEEEMRELFAILGSVSK